MSRELQIIRTGRDRALMFEDLPPELRLRIYEFALTSPDWIKMRKRHGIVSILARQHDMLREIGEHAQAKELLHEHDLLHHWIEDGSHNLEGYFCTHNLRGNVRLPAQLLQISRLINSEATPVLYGTNRLELKAEDFPRLILAWDGHIKHIRHVKIMVPCSQQDYVKKIVRSLSLAHSLRDIEFHSLPGALSQTSVKNMAGHLKGWARRMMKARKLENGGTNSSASEVASIVRFTGASTIDADDYTAQVRTALEELLSAKQKPRKAK